jgi:hypothetical protein
VDNIDKQPEDERELIMQSAEKPTAGLKSFDAPPRRRDSGLAFRPGCGLLKGERP